MAGRLTDRADAPQAPAVRARLRQRAAAVPLPRGRVAGLVWAYLAVATVVVTATVLAFPLDDRIAPPVGVAGIDPRMLGVALWILVGLATSMRGASDEGRAAIVLGVSSVVGAFALGGPAAGVWVAIFGSIEMRELRGQVPWYGVLANRAILVIPAALGGVVTLTLRSLVPPDTQLIDFVEVMAGAGAFTGLNLLLAVVAVWARTGRRPSEAIGLPWRTIAIMMAAESALAWIFAAAYVAIGWWSPAGLVIADEAASASVDQGRAGWLLRHNQLTLLPNRLSLNEHAHDLRRSDPSGACVFYIDLDGFKEVNDSYDHLVGDDVLKEIGRRLSAARRSGDFLAHLHGDEFLLLAAGVGSETDAEAVVQRLTTVIEQPIEHDVGTLRVSASIGFRLVADLEHLDDAVRRADQGMAAAKRQRRRPARATASRAAS